MKRNRYSVSLLILLPAAALALSLSACSSSPSNSTEGSATDAGVSTEAVVETTLVVETAAASEALVASTPASSASGETDVTAGVKAAKWSNNVKISFGPSTFTFASDGLPSHELPDQFLIPDGQPTDPNTKFVPQDTKTNLKGSAVSTEIPLKPVYSETVTKTSLGQIGVMISGAQLFNDYEDPQLSVVAIDDNKRVTPVGGAAFLDSCNGHPLMDWTSYHYHGVPYCITDAIDVAGEHSRILGFVKDGFPVYGPQNTDGTKLKNADLDECSGHVGPTPEFPNGMYHYHLTDDAAPYSLDCYHGVVAATAGGNGGPPNGPPNGGPPDFTDAATKLGVTADQLQAALGRPPFDLDAAAKTLGVTAEALKAALPAPPQGNGG
jgi:YHYH protein